MPTHSLRHSFATHLMEAGVPLPTIQRLVDTFLKRFLCHVLPERFMRIRHYGFLANRYRREKLGRIRCLLGVPPRERLETPATVEWLAALLGIDLARCPCCGGPLSQREIPRDESYWQGAAAKQPARAPPWKGAA